MHSLASTLTLTLALTLSLNHLANKLLWTTNTLYGLTITITWRITNIYMYTKLYICWHRSPVICCDTWLLYSLGETSCRVFRLFCLLVCFFLLLLKSVDHERAELIYIRAEYQRLLSAWITEGGSYIIRKLRGESEKAVACWKWTQDTWLLLPVFCHWSMTTGLPPALTTLYA